MEFVIPSWAAGIGAFVLTLFVPWMWSISRGVTKLQSDYTHTVDFQKWAQRVLEKHEKDLSETHVRISILEAQQ